MQIKIIGEFFRTGNQLFHSHAFAHCPQFFVDRTFVTNGECGHAGPAHSLNQRVVFRHFGAHLDNNFDFFAEFPFIIANRPAQRNGFGWILGKIIIGKEKFLVPQISIFDHLPQGFLNRRGFITSILPVHYTEFAMPIAAAPPVDGDGAPSLFQKFYQGQVRIG